MGDRSCADISQSLEVANGAPAGVAATVEVRDVPRESLQWVAVAWPGLLAQAQQLHGQRWSCSCCGRTGRVVDVVPLEEWRRTHVGCKEL
jgi:hypothetical protein